MSLITEEVLIETALTARGHNKLEAARLLLSSAIKLSQQAGLTKAQLALEAMSVMQGVK